MYNSEIFLDIEKILDSLEILKKSVNSFNSNLPTIKNTSSNGFIAFKDAGFDCSIFEKYDRNVENLGTYLNNFYNIINNYIDGMSLIDSNVSKEIPKYNVDFSSKTKSINSNFESSDVKINNIKSVDIDGVVSNIKSNMYNGIVLKKEPKSNIHRRIINSINNIISQKMVKNDDINNIDKIEIRNVSNKNNQQKVFVSDQSLINKRIINDINNKNSQKMVKSDNINNIDKIEIRNVSSKNSQQKVFVSDQSLINKRIINDINNKNS